ncbi:hypothetical protein [Roseococcus sp. YIM B11640]|uniref:hypothetical protein n=1 Tax=Roseococcus sp. YIM B11640 TaxID=3133973 RepID=UPI003C7D9F93
MDDIDHVFARFGGDSSATNDQREHVTVPRRGALRGSRVVEVVHVRSAAPGDKPGEKPARRHEFSLRAETWAKGFPAKTAAPAAAQAEAPPEPAAAPPPVAHVMPMWTPTSTEAEDPPPAPVGEAPIARRRRQTEAATPSAIARRSADPFDENDDRANCMRCGFVVEAERDKRGLMTCAACA